MDDDYGILEETALEEAIAALDEDFEDDEDLDFEEEDSFYDDFDLDLEYGFEDYEPSPYDGTYSEE